MKKAIAAFILALSLILCACGEGEQPAQVFSEASEKEEFVLPSDLTYPVAEYSSEIRSYTYDTNCFADIPYVGIYDACSLKALYTQNSDTRIYPASLTKMVTASVAVKYGDLDDVFLVGTELDLVKSGSSLAGIKKGMRISLGDLLYCLMLPSGNDAAYTVAVNIARSVADEELSDDTEAVEYFCGLMNDYCESIGAYNSRFTTPEGWDDEGQYVTLDDLAVIASRLLKNEILSEVVSAPSAKLLIKSGETIELINTNYMLNEASDFYNPDVIGIKTGFTDFAMHCLVSAVRIDGTDYICMACFCPDRNSKFTVTQELIKLARRYHYAFKSGEVCEMLPQ